MEIAFCREHWGRIPCEKITVIWYVVPHHRAFSMTQTQDIISWIPNENVNTFELPVFSLCVCVCVEININGYADWKIIKWVKRIHFLKLWLPTWALRFNFNALLFQNARFLIFMLNTKWICAFMFALQNIHSLWTCWVRVKCALIQLCLGTVENVAINFLSFRNMIGKITATELLWHWSSGWCWLSP